MGNISIHDALVNILAEADSVDATNAARKLHAAEDRVLDALLGDGVRNRMTQVQRLTYLHTEMQENSTDDLIILASKNGYQDLFAL